MNKDIIQLIKEALAHLGCPLSVMKNIDANSPVVFSFNNGVVIHCAQLDGAVWLWSPIENYSEQLITQHGAQLLALLLRSSPHFITGKMLLSNENGTLTLQGVVKETSLEQASYFAADLQVFFDTAAQMRQMCKELF